MLNKLITLIFCSYLAVSFTQDYSKIEVGAGPEDFVLDTFATNERLIISCDERRDKKQTVEGDIWEYDLKTEKAKKFIRKNEPHDFIFNPHGIHLINENDSTYLFVVNHFNKNTEIIRYLVLKNELFYQERFYYNSTINSVFALNKHSFVVTNDKKFSGKIVLYQNNQYKTLDKCIKYPNGIYIENNRLYLTTTLSNKVYQYSLTDNFELENQTKIAKVSGADNIRFYNDWLLTTSHYKFLKFIKHFKNPENISPSLVYAININTGEKKELFNNDGSIISAASGGLYYKGNLYIAQVFENFILKVKADL